MSKKLIFYIILIIVILVALFLSQQVASGLFIKKALSGVSDQASAYLAKGSNWITAKIWPKIGQDVQSGGEVIKTGVDSTKENISDSVKKVKNYISGIKDAVTGKENNNCPPNPPAQNQTP